MSDFGCRKSFPDGVLRHEHALQGQEEPQRQARGVYAKMQAADKPSFAIEYDKNDGTLNITGTVSVATSPKRTEILLLHVNTMFPE